MVLIKNYFFLSMLMAFSSLAHASDVKRTIKSWVELRDEHIVKQAYDYSCGSSALATLMNFYFGDKVTEDDLIADVSSYLSKKEMQDRVENGLSILDLKQVAERRKYEAVGVKLPIEALLYLKGPILVYIEKENNHHFAIFRGVKEDRVYLADPNQGNIRMSVDRFSKIWNGTALILGKKNIGLLSDYPLKVKDQIPIRNELSVIRRALPGNSQ